MVVGVSAPADLDLPARPFIAFKDQRLRRLRLNVEDARDKPRASKAGAALRTQLPRVDSPNIKDSPLRGGSAC
jgi:hypothetical protein